MSYSVKSPLCPAVPEPAAPADAALRLLPWPQKPPSRPSSCVCCLSPAPLEEVAPVALPSGCLLLPALPQEGFGCGGSTKPSFIVERQREVALVYLSGKPLQKAFARGRQRCQESHYTSCFTAWSSPEKDALQAATP